MPVLNFPEENAVGTVAWQRRLPGQGPTMAIGSIDIPDDSDVELRIAAVGSIFENEGGRTSYSVSSQPVDLGFLDDFPTNCIETVHLGSAVVPESLRFLPRLAPSLRHLYVAGTGLSDDALEYISQLTGLTYLQTFDNNFTNEGVQVLVRLQMLESLYLEEESLTVEALKFAPKLPHLRRLGLQDVPLQPGQLAELRAALPGVDVG